ncbi:MAG: hypothetical protein Q4B07_04640 [Clostridia bacterium]|nr:hypothetical protein [Clostridia bacterium]
MNKPRRAGVKVIGEMVPPVAYNKRAVFPSEPERLSALFIETPENPKKSVAIKKILSEWIFG